MAIGHVCRCVILRSKTANDSCINFGVQEYSDIPKNSEEGAMNNSDKDPISLDIGRTLDQRFADFGISTDNLPSSADGSVKIHGFADFAVRRQLGKSNRAYILGIRSAFLEIRTMNCDFHPNPEMDDCLQKGKFSEKNQKKQEDKRDWSIKAVTKVSQEITGATASGGAGFSNEKHAKTDLTFQYSEYRVRWEAGGWRLGDIVHGDRLDRDGILRGRFLRGLWGTLLPSRGTSEYGAVFRLLLQKGSISIIPEEWELNDYYPGSKRKNEDDAFQGLLRASAEWLIEDDVKKFDSGRSELLLGFGHIHVDLDLLRTIGHLESDNKSILPKPE